MPDDLHGPLCAGYECGHGGLGPRVVDIELLPNIGADESDRLDVPNVSDRCGKQEILIVAETCAEVETVATVGMQDNGPCYA